MATGSLHQLGGNRWRLCNRQHMLQWAQAIPTDGGWGGGHLWNITWHFLLIWSYIVTNHKERLSCTSEWLCKNLFKGKLLTTPGISSLASLNQAAWTGCILSHRLGKRWIACSDWCLASWGIVPWHPWGGGAQFLHSIISMFIKILDFFCCCCQEVAKRN